MSIDNSETNNKNELLKIPKLTTLAEQLLRQFIAEQYAENNAEILDRKKEWLIGSKQSLLDAIIALQTLELKQAELAFKMQSQHSNLENRNLDKDDLRIIDQFLANQTSFAKKIRITEKNQTTSQDAKKRKPATKRNSSSGL